MGFAWGADLDLVLLSQFLVHASLSKKQAASKGGRVKGVTCALMVETPSGVLLVHPTGHRRTTSWSFPKGLRDEGESSRDAAIRECLEETDLDVHEHVALVRDLGVFSYAREKDYQLFALKMPNLIEITNLKCKSMFEGHLGDQIPECDDFCVIPLIKAVELLNPKQAAIVRYLVQQGKLQC